MGEIKVAGITLDVDITGEGPPLLYLPAESFGPLHSPFLTGLSEHWKVYAPRHPGFDGRTPPDDFRRVEDLAYLYLDLLGALNLDRLILLGASFGGWIAMEMAVRAADRLSALGLIAPVGAKLGTSSSWSRSDNSTTSQTVAAGQSGPSSNTTMLQPDKASAAAPKRKIFWQIVLIFWSLLAVPQSIVKTSNDPNRILLRLISKENIYYGKTRRRRP